MTKHLATIASIYTTVVSAAAAEAVDLSYKVRPRALFAIAWSDCNSGQTQDWKQHLQMIQSC
jgi:hypothetical protein